jgi:integrase
VRSSDGHGGNWTKGFAVADDHEDANGDSVLTFAQAQAAARSIANGGKASGSGIAITVAGAIERYRKDLIATNRNPYNARLAAMHLPARLLAKPVQLLSTLELQDWRNGLLDGRTPATVNRVITTVSAACMLAAELNPAITNRAWKIGLHKLDDADVRHGCSTVLPVDKIRELVNYAYTTESVEFGRLVECMATTGARRSQLARLMVSDLQADHIAKDGQPDPRLQMPTSKKGKRNKKITRRPVPITPATAAMLRVAAAGRPGNAPLLTRPDGGAWLACDPRLPFARCCKGAGLDPDKFTPLALRHSSITRQLLANVPVRLVASAHDTSIAMIEKTYSAFITEHTNAGQLLDLAPLVNVVPLAA